MSHTKILDRWADHVERDGQAPAFATPARVWSRLELAEFTAGLRRRLARGTGPVLVACADPVPVTAAILACAATGRTFAPVDIQQPAARWTALAQDMRPATVVTDAAGSTALAGQAALAADTVERIQADDIEPAPWHVEEWRGLDVADTGYVYFTSGTTGRPKGIKGSLIAVEHFLAWETDEFDITAGTRVSLLTSPGFDAFLRDVLVPLCAGGSVRAPEPGTVPVGAALARWLEREEVEVVHCVPTVFRTLRAAELSETSLPRLRTVLLAGEPVRPSDVDWWRGLFADRKDLVNLYGPSETTMTKVFRRLSAEDAQARTVPVGVPMPGVEVRVLVGGEPATEAIGEVEIRTPFPLGGYLNGRAGGFRGTDAYRTGDLGRLRPDGALEVLGRRDQQAKINGVRVELGEVEDVLRGHPDVHDACAAAMSEGDSDQVLCAYVVAPDTVTDADLRDHAAAALAPGCRPAVYVRLAGIPRTLNGKADRRALPSPSAVRAASSEDRPREGAEALITQIWCELLHLPSVGRHDSFTLLGGDSLGIARLLDRLRSLFGVEVPLRAFVEDPTIAGLAAVVTAGSPALDDTAGSIR